MIKKYSDQDNRPKERTPHTKVRGVLSFVDTSQQTRSFLAIFGHKVRENRETLQLTQEELAKLVPMDRSYLAQIELGKRQISLWKAFLLAKALNVSLNDLIG